MKQPHSGRASNAVSGALRTALARPPPLPTYRATCGTMGEYFTLGAAPKSARAHLVFLPGNPGLIGFYRHALSRVLARSPADVREAIAVHALGLPGHDTRKLNGAATYDVPAHTAYVRKYVEDLPRNGRLIFVGHSYGSHLALTVLNNLAEQERRRRNPASLLLMPCVWQMARCAGALTRAALNDPFGAVSTTAWALAQALNWFGGIKYGAHIAGDAEVTMKRASTALFRNVGSLARSEMKSIIQVPERCTESPTHVLWVDRDKWCPDETVQAIRKSHGDDTIVEKHPDVQHAFVMDRDDTEKVAATLASWIVPLVREDQEEAEEKE